jgi:hypothetical protein
VRRIEHRAVIEADRVGRIRHSAIAEDPQEVVAGGQVGETQPLAVGRPEDAAGRVEYLHVDVAEGVLERHHHVARRGPRGEQREGIEVDAVRVSVSPATSLAATIWPSRVARARVLLTSNRSAAIGARAFAARTFEVSV